MASTSAAAPPNVLYVVLEDFSTLASPVFADTYGDGGRRSTPHLRRLAARGVVFKHAYCQAPICNPSRTSFMTSRRPSSTRVYTNDDLNFPRLPTLVVRSPACARHRSLRWSAPSWLAPSRQLAYWL